MSDRGELDASLTTVLGDEVRNVVRLSGGASRDTFAFEARLAGDWQPLILQRERGGVVRTSGGIETEAALLRAARAAAVPVPELVASGDGTAGLGAAFLITRRIEGETIARKILRDDEFSTARRLLAGQCGTALAAVHTIAPDPVMDLEDVDQVARYREILDQFDEPHPAFELGFRWLEANRPPLTRRTIVHGDFRLGNLIVGADGLRAVLDWEIAHMGDPMEDLGWLCVNAWRFGGDQPVAGVGPYEALFNAYQEASGTKVDPDVVRWWEIVGTLKWGVMCIMQASVHLLNLSRSVELAAIGRRVCEQEYDLVNLLLEELP